MNDCIKTVNHSKVMFSEKKSEFIIENPQRREIERHNVDNCIFKNDKTFKKCDWLAVDVLSELEIYIELKGQDVDDETIEQIINTIDKLSKDKDKKETKLACIVHTSSRIPDIDSLILKKEKMLWKSHKVTFLTSKTPYSVEIEKLIAMKEKRESAKK